MSAPLPPADLARREPQLIIVPVGSIVHRFYTAKFDPIFFDRSREGRLNAPDASYGVLYVARDIKGAFAETFLRRPGATILDPELLKSQSLYSHRDPVGVEADKAHRLGARHPWRDR